MIFLGVRRKTKGIIFHVRKKSRGGVDFSNFPEGYTPPTPQPGWTLIIIIRISNDKVYYSKIKL